MAPSITFTALFSVDDILGDDTIIFEYYKDVKKKKLSTWQCLINYIVTQRKETIRQ